MDIFGQYSFPVNVRELENIIERSVVLESSSIVLPESLTLSYFQTDNDNQKETQRDVFFSEGINLKKIILEIEKDYIFKALEMS